MSWWGVSTQEAEFSALLDKTTSDLLPSSAPADLLSSLHLADLIRSTSLPPTAASKLLLKRLAHDNPNVQLLALEVLDVCIKNGGTPFLTAVADRDGAGELDRLARGAENRDVREKVRAKVQDWATAFEGKDGLGGSELVRRYRGMREEGITFPARDPTATAAMVDSLSAPEWTDSPCCTRCRTDFSTFNRKHHCRNCGRVFDAACSSQTLPLPHFGITEPVRVCDSCAKSLKEGGKGVVPQPGLARSTSLGASGSTRFGELARSATYAPDSKGRTHRTSSSTSALAGSRQSARGREEEDLAKAIAASLVEAGGASAVGGPAFQLRDPGPVAKAPVEEEEEDPDLAAAIAASLREAAPAPSAPGGYDVPTTSSYASLYPSATQHAQAAPLNPYAPKFAPLPSYDLSPLEANTLHTFAATLEHPPPQIGSREHELYVQARAAAPRLERGLDDASRRREILVEMNQKLSEATRLYEGLLDERVRQVRSPQPQAQAQGGQYSGYGQAYAPQRYAPVQVAPSAYGQAYPTLPPQQLPPASYAPGAYGAAPAPAAGHYAYNPPPMGQPLPGTVLPPAAPQHYEQPYPEAQAPPEPHSPRAEQQYAPSPYPQQVAPQQQEPTPVQQAPPQQQQQQQQQQPAGYYTQASFPAVPTAPLFPAVPKEQPWERREEAGRVGEEAPVGELIEL